MSPKRSGKKSKVIKKGASWLLLFALFCLLNAATALAEPALDGKYLRVWIKGNGKQVNLNNGQLQVAKLKKKDYNFNVKLVTYDCDGTDAIDFTLNDCGGYCYDIILLKPDPDNCEEEDIGDLYTCGSNEKTGSAIIEKFDDPDYFEAAIITKQVFKNGSTLKKLESKAGSGKIDDETTSIEPDSVFKNVVLKATEITEEELDCTPEPPE
jgi:hypothetical protein